MRGLFFSAAVAASPAAVAACYTHGHTHAATSPIQTLLEARTL